MTLVLAIERCNLPWGGGGGGGGEHTCVQPTYTRQGMNRLLDLIIPPYEALIVKEGGGGDGNSYIPPATTLCSSPASSHYKSQSQRLL